MENQFNHELESIPEAVGLGEEGVIDAQKRMNEIVQEERAKPQGEYKTSKIIERFSKELTPVELAFATFSLHEQLSDLKMKSDPIGRMIRSMGGE